MTRKPQTLGDLLRRRAGEQGSRTAYTFLVDGEVEGPHITYADLDRSARRIAAELAARGVSVGDRALLLYPPGLDFIAAFFGCMYAGVIAVPSFPPHPAQVARALPRLVGIATDADLSVVLTTSALVSCVDAISRNAPLLGKTAWVATDALERDSVDDAALPGLSADALAFLQYTSGSTSAPKGVMVSHANLLHNLGYANYVEENDRESVSVSWLPVIHDMGLIEGVLEPMFAAYPAYLMAPAAFLQRPVRWLRAMSKYRATNSGGPNFAYDLCVRKVTDAQLSELDLSAWRVAYNGAEPVCADTLVAFHERFQSAGFRWRSFYPVYGLAEATLVVSSGRRSYEPSIRPVDAGAIGRGGLLPPTSATSIVRRLVPCGHVGFDTHVAIVDPETLRACEQNQIGEIWVKSPSVARGYWRRAVQTAETFGAYLDNGDGPFLRTGDLGTLSDGELIVTGRLKDVLIVRGLKHYPQDLELTAERQHSALRPGCSAAFAIERDGAESVVIAAGIDPRQLPAEEPARTRQLCDIASEIRRAIVDDHGIVLDAISFIAIGAVPKTSSGKLRRHACRAAFVDETLDEFLRWSSAATPGFTPSRSTVRLEETAA
jgi:acyl-CoA synthetase (AMP-forming)/AMP-acid ligase II